MAFLFTSFWGTSIISQNHEKGETKTA